jgi:hypothetical protein
MSESEIKHPPVVPIEYAGLWIAWDRQQARIVSSGTTVAEARDRAIAAGEPRPLLAKVPPVDSRFVG